MEMGAYWAFNTSRDRLICSLQRFWSFSSVYSGKSKSQYEPLGISFSSILYILWNTMGTYNVSSSSLPKFLFIDSLTFLRLFTRCFISSSVNCISLNLPFFLFVNCFSYFLSKLCNPTWMSSCMGASLINCLHSILY